MGYHNFAVERPDGSVAVHTIIGIEPSEAQVRDSLRAAGIPATGNMIKVALSELPDRAHRAAWVLRGGKVEIDPARIAAPAPAPAAEVKPDLVKMITDLQLQVEYIARNTVSSVEVVK